VLLPAFEWLESHGLGLAIRQSLWAFPVIEACHLLGLCLLGGSILIVDLRLLGAGLADQRIASVATRVRPFLLAGIAVMLLTGVPLFLSEAVKCYYNTSFWVKMATLPVALTYTFGVREQIARRETLDTSALSRLVGLGSIALWLTVAAAGRWIGFS
jgi:Family of unknown function (DUF6644)